MNWSEFSHPVDVGRRRTESLRSRGFVSVFGLAVQGIIRLANNVLVGRYAGPAALGVFTSGQATAQFMCLLGPTASGQAASKFIAGVGDKEEQSRAVAHFLSRHVLLNSALLAAFTVPVWAAISDATLRDSIPVGLLMLGLAGQAYTRGVHYGVGAVRRASFWDVTLSGAGFLALCVALSHGWRGTDLLLPIAASLLLLTAACWPWRTHTPKIRDSAMRRQIRSFVFHGSVGAVASAGLIQLSTIAAKIIGGDLGAGHFSAALSLTLPITLVSSALSLNLFPILAAAYGRGDNAYAARQVDRATQGLAALLMPIIWLVVVFADQLVLTIWGADFAHSGTLLAILVSSVLWTMLAIPSVNSITSESPRGIARLARASAVGLCASVVAWTTIGEWLGMVGVALGYLLGILIPALTALTLTWRRGLVEWKALAARVLTGFGIIVLFAFWQETHGLNLLTQISATVLFFAVWLAANRRQYVPLLQYLVKRG